jgi:DNA invertase Pin-like site-specific DNA recombinase
MEDTMRIGYARTSTVDQVAGFEAQVRDLRGAGCEKIFQEQTSAVGPRAELEGAVEFMREDDTLVVTKLDRLARSVPHLVEITRRLEEQGIGLVILDLGIDTATPSGKLVLNVIGAIGQFEREMMLERQREGIARAKAEGKYRGRKPTARARAKEVMALREEGVGATEIARRLGIGRASVYRILEDARAGA